MSQEQEGSKAMTIYIVACFALAMGALVAFKFTKESRDENATEYVALNRKNVDISGAYSPSIRSWYRGVRNGDYKPVDKYTKDNTPATLKAIAEKIGIRQGTGNNDRLQIPATAGPGKEKYKKYREYEVMVRLKNVSQAEWAQFLQESSIETGKWTHVKKINLKRTESKYAKIPISPESGNRYVDRTRWDVDVTFVWFGPKET